MSARVDLSAVGSLDWVHWGPPDAGRPVRKRGGSGAVVVVLERV